MDSKTCTTGQGRKKNTSQICVVGSLVEIEIMALKGDVRLWGLLGIFSKLLPWFTYLGAVTGLHSNWTHKPCKLPMVIFQSLWDTNLL